jgi:hypothetical protein
MPWTTSLALPNSIQRADQVKPDVRFFGNIGRDVPYFDPLAFDSVTQPRLGNAGFPYCLQPRPGLHSNSRSLRPHK